MASEPPSNGTTPPPVVHPLNCLHEDRWDSIQEDIREIKTTVGAGHREIREEMRAANHEVREDLRKLRECVLGGTDTSKSMKVDIALLKSQELQRTRKETSWRQGIAAVVIAVVSPGLLWVGSEMRGHIAGHPAPAPITVAASPSPSALPIVASSPGHTMASPDPGIRIVIDGQEPPPNPHPLPAPAATPQRPGGPKPNTRPPVAACKRPAKPAAKTPAKPKPRPAPSATPHR